MRLGALVVLVVVGLGCAVLVAALGDHGSTATIGRQNPATPSESSGSPDNGSPDSGSPDAHSSNGAVIFVHILGAVERPGLYSLREGDRAIDAVAAAGGFTDVADHAALNLARFVVDGEQIYVPALGETPVGGSGLNAQGKVNINTADAPALETLPRVGPALAARIIDWRNANGRFASVEDLMSVTGIGQKTFDGLRDLVTV